MNDVKSMTKKEMETIRREFLGYGDGYLIKRIQDHKTCKEAMAFLSKVLVVVNEKCDREWRECMNRRKNS